MSELSGVGRAFLLLLLITSLGGCFVWAFWEIEEVRDRRRRRVAVAKRWILVVGSFGLMALPAPGRDLDGRYKNSPLRLVREFGKRQRALLFGCRRPHRRRGRLGNKKRSLSRTRAESPQLQRYDLGGGAGRCRHHRAQ